MSADADESFRQLLDRMPFEKKEERAKPYERPWERKQIPFQFLTPKNILRSVVAPQYSLDDGPESISYLAYHYAQATGYDHSGVMVACMVTASALIHDGVQLEVRPGSMWYESARIWGLLIGAPSTGKTPCIRIASDYVASMHALLVQQWEESNRTKEKGEPLDPRPALFTSSATIAAMEELLKDNPQGILLRTGEFGSWIGMIDGSTRGEGAANRGDWLQLYDGGARQSNRISRGNTMVQNWSACVLAGVQPQTLQENMRHMPEDGLIHRFIPCIMQSSGKRNPDADARPYQTAWHSWLAHLRTIRPQTVFMTTDALAAFDSDVESVKELAKSAEDFAPSIAAQLGKHGGQLARLVLTFHCLSVGPNERGLMPSVSLDTVQRAIRFLATARRHVGSMFNDLLTTSDTLSLARAVARSIVAESGALSTIGRTWVSDHCAEFRKVDDRTKREAMQMLQDADWLEVDSSSRYGGWANKWGVHPRLQQLFGKEGEEWRKRREAVRQLITGEEPDDFV